MPNTAISSALWTKIDFNKAKPGLIYDPEGICLIGKFSDELAAHRARKQWKLILNSHFLLEVERDFEISVISSHNDERYLLACAFTSACGRYAFWRLANRQAPEAEDKLGGLIGRARYARGVIGSNWPLEDKQTAFVMSAMEQQIADNEANLSLMNRLLQLFK